MSSQVSFAHSRTRKAVFVSVTLFVLHRFRSSLCPDDFRSCCDLMNAFFVLDDHTDAVDVTAARILCDAAKDGVVDHDKPRPDGEHIIGELARQYAICWCFHSPITEKVADFGRELAVLSLRHPSSASWKPGATTLIPLRSKRVAERLALYAPSTSIFSHAARTLERGHRGPS